MANISVYVDLIKYQVFKEDRLLDKEKYKKFFQQFIHVHPFYLFNDKDNRCI